MKKNLDSLRLRLVEIFISKVGMKEWELVSDHFQFFYSFKSFFSSRAEESFERKFRDNLIKFWLWVSQIHFHCYKFYKIMTHSWNVHFVQIIMKMNIKLYMTVLYTTIYVLPHNYQYTVAPKYTEIWSEKVPDLSHLGQIWPTLGPNQGRLM